jgi:hypothetical protein
MVRLPKARRGGRFGRSVKSHIRAAPKRPTRIRRVPKTPRALTDGRRKPSLIGSTRNAGGRRVAFRKLADRHQQFLERNGAWKSSQFRTLRKEGGLSPERARMVVGVNGGFIVLRNGFDTAIRRMSSHGKAPMRRRAA